MALRKIVSIDEEKCDGCGQCVPACVEGAIQIIDGTARLVSETYCDGLGACLGECPNDAISIEEREADEFDEEAANAHVKSGQAVSGDAAAAPGASCPGSAPRVIERCELVDMKGEPGGESEAQSRLGNWPVQLQLVPPKAPYFEGAHLLVAADCVPFAFADFHDKLLTDRVLIIGCPKLDSFEFYRKKLAQIFIQNDIKAIDVAYMEVPCCFGLVHLVHESLKESGKKIPLTLVKVGIKGDIIETVQAEPGDES